ncbi:hypothetical protein PCCS19_57670 [Paenibacillus sp. CCS19]|nr:hypothetical protein PCCS19_57670 [Paenibacillus cellulosilyticus]
MISMFTRIKALFTPTCPSCKQKLVASHNSVCFTKQCPDGHYKEENYCTLGVRIVYDRT